MGYCGCMGYEAFFPANQLGGLKNLWDLREYGVCEPWVMRESTVKPKHFLVIYFDEKFWQNEDENWQYFCYRERPNPEFLEKAGKNWIKSRTEGVRLSGLNVTPPCQSSTISR